MGKLMWKVHRRGAICWAGEAGKASWGQTLHLTLRFGQSKIRVCGGMGMVDT